MPELPEVENVKLGLRELMPIGQATKAFKTHRPDLRFPFPKDIESKLQGERLLSVERRAKFLIFATPNYRLISHLGMTGSWREIKNEPMIVHDHLTWEFENGQKFVFNDPRRFGFITMFKHDEIPVHFKDLGPEPLETEFTSKYLFEKSRGKRQPLKSFLLDQKNIAGLGNIYVCEALFLARLKPTKHARLLTKDQSKKLVKTVQNVLKAAIKAGGSTIRDYKNADGGSGAFQERFKVYGRDGENCRTCRKPIKILRQAGRSTFWCPHCQK
jgi:formamidopyrimidine-DNA glycosylase